MDAMQFLRSKKKQGPTGRTRQSISGFAKSSVPRGRIIKAGSMTWLASSRGYSWIMTYKAKQSWERGIHFLCACILGVPSSCIFFFYPKMGWGLSSTVSLVLEWPTSTTWFGSWCGRCRCLLTKFMNLIHQTWATASCIVCVGILEGSAHYTNNPNGIVW